MWGSGGVRAVGKAGRRVCRVRWGSEGLSGTCWMEAVDLAAIPCGVQPGAGGCSPGGPG